MAGGGLAPGAGSRAAEYEAEMTIYVVLTCIVAASGGLMFGYDIGVSGGVTSMDEFLGKFFPKVLMKKKENSSTASVYCDYDSQTLQLFTSSLYLAALVATFFASTVTRRYGRKVTMLIGGLFFGVGVILNGAAQDLEMLIFGRILLGCGVGFANQVAIAILLAFGLKDGRTTLPNSSAIALVVLICVFVSAYAWSWGPLGWLISSEIFPLETRSAGQSVTVCANMFFTFVIGQAFLSMLCSMEYGIFLFFAAWVLIMGLFALLFIPETKGIPIEEMEGVWKKHWFWKRIAPNGEDGSRERSLEMGNGKVVPGEA